MGQFRQISTFVEVVARGSLSAAARAEALVASDSGSARERRPPKGPIRGTPRMGTGPAGSE